LLELGTGTGESTSWLLHGMDESSHLTTVELEPQYSQVARRHLGHDKRVTFVVEDGTNYLERNHDERFDLIFADTWPGKYSALEQALALLTPGALYLIDDMLPQSNWPPEHRAKAATLVGTLNQREDLLVTQLEWSTGIVICSKLVL
jgi:predicted O-methyltransferase YrrM